jgi:predicted Fe-Mo cluster-binding NifX family protein
MKAALTVWDGRISPMFDVSRQAVLLTVENGAEIARSTESLETTTAGLKVARLLEFGVDTLVCGAISEFLSQELAARGVRVLGFVAGALEEVIEALLSGGLPGSSFTMPGCCGRQRRFRGGQGQGRRPGQGKGRGNR